MTYYNEFDPYAAQWLQNLSDADLIAPGVVDSRSILEVQEVPEGPAHFFAGIGVWSRALRLAGISDDFPVWTGSCPCQPFSVAGKQKGKEDERHLWPEWRRLIEIHRPPIVFGEQVASAIGRNWLDAVRAEMEALGYAFGAADLCAAGVGAPHIRQRLFFGAVRLGDPRLEGLQGHTEHVRLGDESKRLSADSTRPASSTNDGMRLENTNRERHEEQRLLLQPGQSRLDLSEAGRRGESDGLGNSGSEGGGRNPGAVYRAEEESPFEGVSAWRVVDESFAPGAVRGFWESADWLLCRDPSGVSKWRPVEPGTFPLAHRPSSSVGRLRAYGNAIVAPLAAEFIQAFLESV